MVRPEIVALMVDTDFERSTFPADLVHTDGRPFTEAEHTLVRQAGREELDAADRYFTAAADYHDEMCDDYRRLSELVDAAFADLPDGTLLPQALATLPADQRAEAEEILDRLAPDGTLVINGPGAN